MVSFTTNTNWQLCSGEEAIIVLTQMTGLVVQNFISAAVGITVAVVLVRDLTNHHGDGNISSLWVDPTRTVLRVLLPITAISIILLISQGVIQNFSTPQATQTVADGSQTTPGGAVASQKVIKELGANGGGYFNANSVYPFENPNVWTNILEISLTLLIPVPLIKVFGVTIDNKRQGWAILPTMAVLYFISPAVVMSSETALQVFQSGSVEGKEMRFGVLPSSFLVMTTIMTLTDAADSFHSSCSPLAGGMLMLNMLLGEISPGDVDSDLYGMLVVAVLAVSIADLMVGRTLGYLGERIGVSGTTKVCLYILVMPVLVLAGVDISTMLPSTLGSVSVEGSRGSPDLIYAFTSISSNNDSVFANFGTDTPWFNMSLGFTMLFGRFLPIVMVLGLVGDFVKQQPAAGTADTLPTRRPQFIGLTVTIVIIVSVLTFSPTLALGPLTEILS